MGDGVNIAARLQEICKPGAICLSEDAYRQVRDKFPDSFVDLGEQHLKNIAHPMRAYALASPPSNVPQRRSAPVATKPPDAAPPGGASRRNLGTLFLAFFVAAALGALGTVAWRERAPVAPPSPAPPPAAALDALQQLQDLLSYPNAPRLPGAAGDKLAVAPRLSIIVQPFANLSGDPEQDRLAEGVTDALTTDLSRIPDSVVVSSAAASAYKGKSVDERLVGRELGVRYAVEGSVRRVGHSIEVGAQLVATEAGDVVWSDRIEVERNRPSEIESELASRLGGEVRRALALR